MRGRQSAGGVVESASSVEVEGGACQRGVFKAHRLSYHSTLGLGVITGCCRERLPRGLRRRCLRARRRGGGGKQLCSGSKAGAYLMRIDSCITQLKAQGPGVETSVRVTVLRVFH